MPPDMTMSEGTRYLYWIYLDPEGFSMGILVSISSGNMGTWTPSLIGILVFNFILYGYLDPLGICCSYKQRTFSSGQQPLSLGRHRPRLYGLHTRLVHSRDSWTM